MIIFFAVLFGLAVGSFLNVVVFRTHTDVPLTGRSKCQICEQPIGWFDLIPVFSYLTLRGRCRRCKTAISWQYPLVEAATAALFAVIAWQMLPMDLLATAPYLAVALRTAIFTIFLIIIFVYDLKYSYILDRFTIPGMVIAFLLNLALGTPPIISMLEGAVFAGGFFLLQYVMSRGRWIGGGDVRMGVLMGLMLGLPSTVLALFLSYAVGAIVGIVLILTKKKQFASGIPFGTFLAIGTFAALLWGPKIIGWYLGYFL